MSRTKQTPRWPLFFKQLSFHSVPSLAGFMILSSVAMILLIHLWSLLLDFPCATPCLLLPCQPWIAPDSLFWMFPLSFSLLVLSIALLCSPRPVSSAWFFCKASSIFSVLLRAHQLLLSVLTVCFGMFPLSASWPVLHIALLCPPLPVSSAWFFC